MNDYTYESFLYIHAVCEEDAHEKALEYCSQFNKEHQDLIMTIGDLIDEQTVEDEGAQL